MKINNMFHSLLFMTYEYFNQLMDLLCILSYNTYEYLIQLNTSLYYLSEHIFHQLIESTISTLSRMNEFLKQAIF